MKITRADVVVVGIGTMGSSALWRLACRGVRAVGIEQFSPGHDRGSGHGESRIIRTAYHEGASYVPLVQSAFRYWRELEADSGRRLLQMTGGLVIGAPDSAMVQGALHAARVHRLDHEFLTAQVFRRRFPAHAIHDSDVAVYESQAGFLRPERSIVAAAETATRLGARIITDTRVVGVHRRPDATVDVRTTDRVFRARHVIVTSGAWTSILAPQLAGALTVRRKVLSWFPAGSPADFSPARFPVFMRDTGTATWYGMPTVDGQTVKLGQHSGGEATTADTIDRTTTPADVEPLADFARANLPSLDPTPARTAVCMYTVSPDEHFLVGALPDLPQVTILAGFSGHGFKFAPALGEAAAQLAIDGRTRLPIDDFSLRRLTVR